MGCTCTGHHRHLLANVTYIVYFLIKLQRDVYPIINPEMLGHCFIINNVATEYPGSLKDVEALQTVYEQMKFRVTVYKNCDDRVSMYMKGFLSWKKTDTVFVPQRPIGIISVKI